ncbi:hypothetical protein [uncultured Methylobacterium sp.]|uniref:hypothetical protein n=1 Tax=uncultured Methylobacterium sp. TaxID=157278 RepID=UPI0035CBC02C
MPVNGGFVGEAGPSLGLFGTQVSASSYLRRQTVQERLRMGTLRTTLYAATAAFAAGVGMTVAVTSLNSGGSSVTSQATQPEGPSRTVERRWSDLPKPTESSAPATRQAHPVLRFDDAEKVGKPDVAPTQSASALPAGIQALHQQDRPSPTNDNNPKRALAESLAPGSAAPTPARIALTPSIQARLDTIRAERAAFERARVDRFKTMKVEHHPSEVVRPVVSGDRIPETRRNTVVAQDPPREPVVRRLAAKAPPGERQRLAADKNVRNIVTPMRGFTFAESQRIEASDRRKRVSSADAGGVMKWLMEPSSNF